MEVTANGFPKSGNHALVKALQLLGRPCQVAHITYSEKEGGRHVFIKRDPRNIICSWLRFTGQTVAAGTIISAFRSFQHASLCDEMAAYEGWLTDSDTLVIRYEDLIASDSEMRKIAAHLGVPYIDGAFEHLPGLTRTWFPDHSDYRTIWGEEVAAVWSAEGGTELLSRWGY